MRVRNRIRINSLIFLFFTIEDPAPGTPKMRNRFRDLGDEFLLLFCSILILDDVAGSWISPLQRLQGDGGDPQQALQLHEDDQHHGQHQESKGILLIFAFFRCLQSVLWSSGYEIIYYGSGSLKWKSGISYLDPDPFLDRNFFVYLRFKWIENLC